MQEGDLDASIGGPLVHEMDGQNLLFLGHQLRPSFLKAWR